MSFQRIKERIKEYFTFTRKERNGILMLIMLIFMMQGAVIYTHFLKPASSNTRFRLFEKEILAFEKVLTANDSLLTSTNQVKNSLYIPINPVRTNFAVFDPNTAVAEQWKQFGIKEKTIHLIKNYLAKGGKFRKKEDLRKIYTLKPEEYCRMEPYILIKEDSLNKDKKNAEGSGNTLKKKQLLVIELNKASVEELMLLPLIGEKRAQQIVRYRDLLGGFVQKEQLKEMFGFPDSVYQLVQLEITVDKAAIRHININADSISSLKHLYIKKPFAQMIVNYRLQHGDYHVVEDLLKLPLMSDSLFRKISQYLIVE